jgi:hypothetical protein
MRRRPICVVGQNVNRKTGALRGSFGGFRSQLIVYFALLLALPGADGDAKPLVACDWDDAASLTSICRTGVRIGVRFGVRNGVRMGVRTPNSKNCLKTACHLAFRRHRLADIYMSMQSVPEIRRNRRGARGPTRCVSLAVALLIFALWVDRPAA